MYEAELPVLGRLAALPPINLIQARAQSMAQEKLVELRAHLDHPLVPSWRNLNELDQVVTAQLAAGRAERAAQLLEEGYPPARAPWSVLDRVATIRLHLGEPARARALWQQATSVPESAVAMARVAATYLVEGDLETARRFYRSALTARPDLFEACYSLAVIEQDAGEARAASELALAAAAMAPGDVQRTAARQIASDVARFAGNSRDPATEEK
jgi:tetratricopeptide (TPR) repeat protein